MHPRDRLLGTAKLCLAHDKAVPLDTLAMADEQGFLLTEFGEMQSNHNHNNEKGDALYGSKTTETDFHDL